MSATVVAPFASVPARVPSLARARSRSSRAPDRRVSASAEGASGESAPVEPDVVEGPDGPMPRGVGVPLPLETWTSPTWNWGSARGDAHDAAAVVRAELNTDVERRREWLVALIQSTPMMRLVPWEEAKLVMALAWQLSGHRGTDACETGDGSWLDVMERMRQGVYEDTDEKSLSGGGDRALVYEMEQRLGPAGQGLMGQARQVASEATNGDEEWTHDAVRRAACAAMLLDLEFLEVGI